MTVSFASWSLRYVGGRSSQHICVWRWLPHRQCTHLKQWQLVSSLLSHCALYFSFQYFLHSDGKTVKTRASKTVKSLSLHRRGKPKQNTTTWVFKIPSLTIWRSFFSACLLTPLSSLELCADFRCVSAFTRDFRQNFRHCRYMYKDF